MANKTFEVDIGGKTFEVDAPDAQTAWVWANQTVSKAPKQIETIDPTEGMSGTEKFLAGAGKAIYDLGRGAGQRLRDVLPDKLSNTLGLPTEADIEESRKRDAALMRTGAGMAGNVAANVATTAPVMFVPGANTVAGGAALGAALGYMQPTGKDESAVSNAVAGGAFGGALPAAVSGFKGVKTALYDPIAGQNRVIGGALTRAVGEDNAARVAQALRNRGADTPGVKLSSGAISENEALSALEDAIQSQLPRGELTRNAQVNRTALANALRDIGQDDAALIAAKEARDATAGAAYRNASAESVSPTPAMQEMFNTPAMQEAWKRAQRIAANEGEKISMGNDMPVKALHYLKMGVDDLMRDATSGIGATEKRAIAGLKERFLGELDQLSPEYAAGRQAYTEMSRPVNQMQIGQKLYNTLVPATAGDNPASLNYNALAKALRNPDVVAQQATGFKGATMRGAMDADQLATIQGVSSDAARLGEALKRGMGSGSPTARRLAQGNILSEHFAENAPLTTKLISMASNVPGINLVTKGASAVGGLIGNKINQNMVGKLDEMLANNPQQVAGLIEQELKRLNPSDRAQALKMIPQALMLSLPSMQGAQ